MNNTDSDSFEYKVIVQCFTYNHERYIEDALNGFVIQKTDFPFLVIVVDDFSTDNTASIVRKYELEYPELIKGIYLPYNYYSKKESKRPLLLPWFEKTKYVAICEGDDYWIDPLKLQKQVEAMDSDPNRMFCGTNAIVLRMGDAQRVQLFNHIAYSHDLEPSEIIGNWLLPTPGLMFRKEIMIERPAWCDKVYSGDLTLVLLGINKGKGFALSSISCVYRKDNENKCSASYLAHKKSHAFVTEQHIVLYEEYNKFTNGKYANIIIPHLRILRKRLQVYKAMDKSILLAFLRNPVVFMSILIKRCRRSE